MKNLVETEKVLGPPAAEVRIRLPDFVSVYFSKGTLPQQTVKGHYWGTYGQRVELRASE